MGMHGKTRCLIIVLLCIHLTPKRVNCEGEVVDDENVEVTSTQGINGGEESSTNVEQTSSISSTNLTLLEDTKNETEGKEVGHGKTSKKGGGVLGSYLSGLGAQTLNAANIRPPPPQITRPPPVYNGNGGVRRKPRPRPQTPAPFYPEPDYYDIQTTRRYIGGDGGGLRLRPRPQQFQPAPQQFHPAPEQFLPPSPQAPIRRRTTIPPLRTEAQKLAYQYLQLIEEKENFGELPPQKQTLNPPSTTIPSLPSTVKSQDVYDYYDPELPEETTTTTTPTPMRRRRRRSTTPVPPALNTPPPAQQQTTVPPGTFPQNQYPGSFNPYQPQAPVGPYYPPPVPPQSQFPQYQQPPYIPPQNAYPPPAYNPYQQPPPYVPPPAAAAAAYPPPQYGQHPQYPPYQQTGYPPAAPPLPTPGNSQSGVTATNPGFQYPNVATTPSEYDYYDTFLSTTTSPAPPFQVQAIQTPPTSAPAPLPELTPEQLYRLQQLKLLLELQRLRQLNMTTTTTESPYEFVPRLVINPYIAPTRLTTTTDNPNDAVQDLANLFGSLAVGNLAGVVDGTLKLAGTGVFNNLNTWTACQMMGRCGPEDESDTDGLKGGGRPLSKPVPPPPPQHPYPGRRPGSE